jgi:hypothetical protein
MVAVCKDHADLKIARVIPRAGQRRDFPLGQLGRKSLQRRVGKTNRRHRAAQMRRAARGNFQTEQGEIHFSARRRLSDLRKRNFLFWRDACLKLRSCSPNKSILADAFEIAFSIMPAN